MFTRLITLLILLFFSQQLQAGKLIEICGIDGSGKSTFISDLQTCLTEKNLKVIKLKPLQGDLSVRVFLKKLDLLNTTFSRVDIDDLVSKFKSDYFLLSLLSYKSDIENLLKDYDFVLCDRYQFSHRTYQKCFQKYCISDEKLIQQMPTADITILFTVPVEIAIERIKSRGNPESYENAKFLEEAQNIFLNEQFDYPNTTVFDGNSDRSENINSALKLLEIL